MTTTVRLSEFLPYVLPHAPGCPGIVAETYLRLAAIEFCERTRCWRKISEFQLSEDRTIAIAAPSYASIHEIEYASFSSENAPKTPLIPTQYSDIGERYRGYLEQEGPPRYVTQVNPDSVTVFPLAPGTLEVSMFLKPRMGETFSASSADDPIQGEYNIAPDFLLTQWGQQIAWGALSKVLMQPQTRWTDPQAAGFYLQKFERACDRNFSHGIRGQQRAPRRTRIRFL